MLPVFPPDIINKKQYAKFIAHVVLLHSTPKSMWIPDIAYSDVFILTFTLVERLYLDFGALPWGFVFIQLQVPFAPGLALVPVALKEIKLCGK